MFELSNEAGRDLLEVAKEIESQNEANKSIAKSGEFVANNWIKDGVENETINEINAKGGAVWLSPAAKIMFRPNPTAKPLEFDKDKAEIMLANYLDRESVRLLKGTREVDPDIFPNELLSVSDKFTPFSNSEFFELDGMTYRTPWRPAEYMTIKGEAGEFNAIQMLLERLTNHNAEYYRWVINWVAGFFQSRRRSQCALVLKGDQGSGKGIFFEYIITPLFGEEYCIVIDDDRLHSNFKNWIGGQLFYNLNEISHDMRTRKAVKNFIKQLVTDTKVQAEQKYQDAGAIEVYGQVLIGSNELAPLEIETSDRRYTVIQTARGLKKDGIDTDRLVLDIKRELQYFAVFLLTYRVDWIMFNTALDTPEKRAVVNATTDKVVLLGNAIKMRDVSFLEPMEEVNTHLYNLVCENFGKGFVDQSHIKTIYENVFGEEVKPRYLLDKLRTFDVMIFGQTHKYNGRKCYKLGVYENIENSP